MAQIPLIFPDGRPCLRQQSVWFKYQGPQGIPASVDVLIDSGARRCFTHPATLAALTSVPLGKINDELADLSRLNRAELEAILGSHTGPFKIFGTITSITGKCIGGLSLAGVAVVIGGHPIGKIDLGSTVATDSVCILGMNFINLVTLTLTKGRQGCIEV